MKYELTKHKGTHQWRKRIKGKDYYFGNYDEVPYREALSAMRRKASDLEFGHDTTGTKLSVNELVERWMLAKHAEVKIGLIRQVTYDKYRHIGTFVQDEIGGVKVTKITASDFRHLQIQAAERWGYWKQRDLVTVTRMIFAWGEDEDVINPVKVPRSFRKPVRQGPYVHSEGREGGAKASEEAKWVWTPPELADAAQSLSEPRRPSYLIGCFMLGINCGLGNTDCSGLEWSHIREVEGVMCCLKPRAKTGRPRMIPLWPETVEALGARGEGLVFRTRNGLPLVERRRDPLGQTFKRVTGKPFYGLRHMFMTIGSQVGDAEAVRFMMGHAPKGMADHYILSPSWSLERLTRVVDRVGKWSGLSPSLR